ncbi:MAG: hypothetical protein Q8M93_19000 [Polaromonas sp.]|uniref:hypothetical protein n=1 Tax=Polaromonas sp. TaxID=1869339 RepID=UPI00272F1240|nr:hypothetical protein [Polaromonas sp.]MDP2451885.1 hypothetical protein [Polaromonas sp.]MDP3249038.1 hypothetical protein [Polaromonas sp.]MDP3755680.1 hypothetical protein [Polaromonas sp.]
MTTDENSKSMAAANILLGEQFYRSRVYLNDKELASIGSVAVESTFCEMDVENTIWKLAGLDNKAGPALTSHLSMAARLDAMRTIGLSRLADEALIQEFTEIISRLSVANNSRNVIIHGHWAPKNSFLHHLSMNPEDPARTVVATKARKNSKPLEFPSAQIEGTAKELHEARMDLLLFRRRAWPDIFVNKMIPMRTPAYRL